MIHCRCRFAQVLYFAQFHQLSIFDTQVYVKCLSAQNQKPGHKLYNCQYMTITVVDALNIESQQGTNPFENGTRPS